MELWSLIFEQIDQKDGHIKSEILGGMINFSSRCVIIPDATLKSDEVRLSYMCFLELFKYEIIACLVKMANITENDAYEQWFKARIKYSPKIYEVMNYILKKRKPKILINRNPTINYGSLLCVKVKSVKNEYSEDYTMSLPVQILPVLNADFDGDILNIVSLKIKKLEKAYNKVFNPKFNMYISRNDGLFNNDFNLYKDQLIGLYEFNNI
jgi:DNA-directed RNA polymerase beta' subunit